MRKTTPSRRHAGSPSTDLEMLSVEVEDDGESAALTGRVSKLGHGGGVTEYHTLAQMIFCKSRTWLCIFYVLCCDIMSQFARPYTQIRYTEHMQKYPRNYYTDDTFTTKFLQRDFMFEFYDNYFGGASKDPAFMEWMFVGWWLAGTGLMMLRFYYVRDASESVGIRAWDIFLRVGTSWWNLHLLRIAAYPWTIMFAFNCPEYDPNWVPLPFWDVFWQKFNKSTGGCGDLIFSGHTSLLICIAVVCTDQRKYFKLGKVGTRLAVAWYWFVAVLGSLVLLYRHAHYTVDVTIAWLFVPLYMSHPFWDWIGFSYRTNKDCIKRQK